MESQKSSKLEKTKGVVLKYCLDFLEIYDLILLKQIKNKFLQKILHSKKPPKDFTDILKTIKRTRQTFDFPPECTNMEHKNSSKISRFCESCSQFICNSCFDKCRIENLNKSLPFYTCKNKTHKGTHKKIDDTCLSCLFILCKNCLKKSSVGNLLLLDNLKEFCKQKEKIMIDSLLCLARENISFKDNLDSFFGEIINYLSIKYEIQLKNFTNLEICKSRLKGCLKENLRIKFQKNLALIVLKVYDSDLIDKIRIKKNVYEKDYREMLLREMLYYLDLQNIKQMKIGQIFLLTIEDWHQSAKFVKLTPEEVSDKIKLIPDEGITLYGLAGTNKGNYKCFGCEKSCPMTGFWHDGGKSRFTIDYICEDCQCEVHYSYDWSGPWD